eukprot:6317249-Prymnesium_polylepis.1
MRASRALLIADVHGSVDRLDILNSLTLMSPSPAGNPAETSPMPVLYTQHGPRHMSILGVRRDPWPRSGGGIRGGRKPSPTRGGHRNGS